MTSDKSHRPSSDHLIVLLGIAIFSFGWLKFSLGPELLYAVDYLVRMTGLGGYVNWKVS